MAAWAREQRRLARKREPQLRRHKSQARVWQARRQSQDLILHSNQGAQLAAASLQQAGAQSGRRGSGRPQARRSPARHSKDILMSIVRLLDINITAVRCFTVLQSNVRVGAPHTERYCSLRL